MTVNVMIGIIYNMGTDNRRRCYGFIQLFYMNAPLTAITEELAALLVFVGLCIPLAIVVLQFKINRLQQP